MPQPRARAPGHRVRRHFRRHGFQNAGLVGCPRYPAIVVVALVMHCRHHGASRIRPHRCLALQSPRHPACASVLMK